MPKHRYSGDPRYYPDLAIEVKDGDVLELETAPDDGRWAPVSDTKDQGAK